MQKQKKILLTINDITITGGAERVCVNLANALSQAGHSVEILSFYRANDDLPYPLLPSVRLRYWHDISESSFSTYMCQKPFSKLYYKNLYKVFLSLKVWWQYRHFDMLIANCACFTPFVKFDKMRYVRVMHLNFSKYHTRNNYFDTLAILSSHELATWQSYHKHIKVIPNFLPYISESCTDTTQKRIVSVGRMDRGDQKGFIRLIDIWGIVQEKIKEKATQDILQDWQLVIVGSGDMKEEIEAKIKAKNLQDSIILKPFTKDIESEYLNASIYAMSSHFEGFPMVLLEAGSLGLPCIAFDIATGPSDIIDSGLSGYLIEDNDLQAYADKLLELMSDEAKRKAMGENAKKRVATHFSKEAILPLWEEVLQEGKKQKGGVCAKQ